MKLKLEEIVKATGAEIVKSLVDLKSEVVISTDTRTITAGDIYLPLKGESFDGENFVKNAIDAGAIGTFITRDCSVEDAKIVLKVEDTKQAYLKIANFVRKKYSPKTIAVTGSSGKTTTKEMINSVCSYKFITQKTFSNHNNEIGCCQTILSMPDDCEVLILEMGMRGLKEIELLSYCSEPDIAVITNAGSAHIGRLGSLDNIAIAKCEITSGLNTNGVLIANDSERLHKFAQFSGEKLFYSLKDVEIIEKRAGYSKFEYKGEIYELNIEGEYNIENSIAAIQVGKHLGMSYQEIKNGLLTYKPIEKRWEMENVGDYSIINDSYNANPDSMKAAVKTFAELYRNPVVVLGNMGELGDSEVELHKEVGRYLCENTSKNVRYLTVGNLACEISNVLTECGFEAINFASVEEVSRYILEKVDVDNTIFLKASRAMKFEDIISNLRGEVKL